MQCRVCNHKEVSPFATTCPSCDSDLVQFKLLDNIEESYVNAVKDKIAAEGDLIELEKQTQKEINSSKSRINNLFLLLFLLPLTYFICGKKHIPTSPIYVEIENDSLDYYKKKYTELLKQPNTSDSYQVSSFQYIIRKGDNLEKLSQMFFGNKELWKKIKADNDIPDEHEMIPGDTITINLKYGL